MSVEASSIGSDIDSVGGPEIRARLLQAVPNFSEGRDTTVVRAIVDAMRATGADVLDWSADPDHHRAVVTVVGTPDTVEEAAIVGARIAVDKIDMRKHHGVHPRIGAVDVLPFVPLLGLTMADARASAHRVGARVAADVGVPVFFYADASEPPGRTLPELRRGGFEALVDGWPTDRRPDLLPPRWPHGGAHPSAGASCIGARDLLLAWNVTIGGVSLDGANGVAEALRESGGGRKGVRALAFMLPMRDAIQISMNLEQLGATSPMQVFRQLEELVQRAGGSIIETEVIGMVPDQLVFPAAAERLQLAAGTEGRLLSRRLVEHLGRAGLNQL